MLFVISWKKNQACCSAASLTELVLTTHCNASSSWSSFLVICLVGTEKEATLSRKADMRLLLRSFA